MGELFEDLQYFDSASCRLLSALTAALPSDVLVIATYRPSSSHVAVAESDSRHGGGAGSSSASNFPAVLQACSTAMSRADVADAHATVLLVCMAITQKTSCPLQ